MFQSFSAIKEVNLKMSSKEFKFTEIYEKLGIIGGKYDGEKIQKSWKYSLQLCFKLFSIFSVALKNFISSMFFDKDDPIQFYLGDW